MIQMTLIGHLGSDAEVKVHGTECVINFSCAHTDKWNDNGIKKERTTWVSCSWWTERSTVAQYLKRGTLVYISGIPEARSWKGKSGDTMCGLNLRVHSLQLLGGKRDGDNQPSQQAPAQTQNTTTWDSPHASNSNSSDDDSLPF